MNTPIRIIRAALVLSSALAAAACASRGGVVQADVLLRPERGPNDIANRGIVRAFGVTWSAASEVVATPRGAYRVEWMQEAWGGLGNKWRLAPVEAMQAQVTDSLRFRATAMLADTTAVARAMIPQSGKGAPPDPSRPLVAARVPFVLIAPHGERVARIAMLQRHAPGNAADSLLKNSRLIGTASDTVRVAIPVDVWMPGDSLYVIERNDEGRERFSMRVVLTCAPANPTCNPLTLGTRGATGYLPYLRGWTNVVRVD